MQLFRATATDRGGEVADNIGGTQPETEFFNEYSRSAGGDYLEIHRALNDTAWNYKLKERRRTAAIYRFSQWLNACIDLELFANKDIACVLYFEQNDLIVSAFNQH